MSLRNVGGKKEERERRRDSPEHSDLGKQRLSLIQIRELDGGFENVDEALGRREPGEET